MLRDPVRSMDDVSIEAIVVRSFQRDSIGVSTCNQLSWKSREVASLQMAGEGGFKLTTFELAPSVDIVMAHPTCTDIAFSMPCIRDGLKISRILFECLIGTSLTVETWTVQGSIVRIP